MVFLYLFPLMLLASLCEISEAQCITRRPWSSSCGYDELNVLLTLARAIEENENSKASCKSGIDVEEIIMKLINALIYTTISGNNGRGGAGGSGGAGGTGGAGGSGGGSTNKSDESLIDLGLLNPNDHDNVLKLDLAKQKLLGVGLGNTN